MSLREIKLCDNENIKVHGRTIARRNPVTLVWTGSAIEMNVKCSQLYIELEGCYVEHENWIVIEVNGAVVARQMIEKERRWICVFRNKMAEKVTNVRIIKEVQAMNADPEHCLNVYAVRLDGEILPVGNRELKIEFIGDSISSGEGTIGAKEEEEWISMFFGHEYSYPYLTAKALNADYRVFSQSGWGVYSSWDNQKACSLPKHYEQICSLVLPEKFEPLGFYEKHDFITWQPDFICVNLGTNDDGAFHNPAFVDPVTGCETKLHMEGDVYVEEDRQKVKKAMVDFLYKLRKCNPDAYILWCYGILGSLMKTTILDAIDEYQSNTKDTKVKFVGLPDTTDETMGSRMHPGYPAHQQATEVIVKKIQELIHS